MALFYILSFLIFLELYVAITVTFEDEELTKAIEPMWWWSWVCLVSFMIPYFNLLASLSAAALFSMYTRKTFGGWYADFTQVSKRNKLAKLSIQLFNKLKTLNGKNN